MKGFSMVKSINLLSIMIVNIGLLTVISPQVNAGSGGAIGGDDSGSNPDSSTFIGDPFGPANTKIILEPADNTVGVNVDNKTGKISVSSDTASRLREVALTFENNYNNTLLGEVLGGASPILNCAGGDSSTGCRLSNSAVEFIEKLRATLQVTPASSQDLLLTEMVRLLQGLTWENNVNPTQLDLVIKSFNALVDSLEQPGLFGLRDSEEGKGLREFLQQLRTATGE